MSSVQDHVDAFAALLAADATLKAYNSKVPNGAPSAYVLFYPWRRRPDGLVAPDRVPLTGQSVAVDMVMYCHCVGSTIESATSIQGRVESLLLDVTPTVAGRVCFPIRLVDSQPAGTNEQTLAGVFDAVDVYGWSSQPA